MKTFRPCVAEFLGTFYLCFAGIAAILSNTPAVGGMSGLLGIALAHGIALSIAVNVFGGESGAHLNPAVSLAFALSRHFPWTNLFGYWAAQLAGAFAAAAILRGSLATSRTWAPTCRPVQRASRSCGSWC